MYCLLRRTHPVDRKRLNALLCVSYINYFFEKRRDPSRLDKNFQILRLWATFLFDINQTCPIFPNSKFSKVTSNESNHKRVACNTRHQTRYQTRPSSVPLYKSINL